MADTDDAAKKKRKNDEEILSEARTVFKRNMEWESPSRANFTQDIKFAYGDAYNHWQWPDNIWGGREDEQRPSLTINKTRLHNNQIINDALQNKAAVRIRPTGGNASYLSADAMQALVRRIEYISKAQAAYKTAFTFQVDGGIGYVTLHTDYISDRSFDQDIFIKRVRDPLSIVLDRDIKEIDGSDARNGFQFEDVPRELFEAKYPKYKGVIGQTTFGEEVQAWVNRDHIRRAMYYRKEDTEDRLISFVNPENGERETIFESDIDRKLRTGALRERYKEEMIDHPDTKVRDVINESIRWFLIAGDVIVQRGDWAGKYIPICRCVGVETIINGQLDRKGHTRSLIDQQRMLNYNASAQVEYGALQNKVPYTGAADAFEGQEGWKDANRKNYAFLQFNHLDQNDQPIPPQALPQRQQPPMSAPIYAEGMRDAEVQMMMASGQYQAQMGEKDNTTSGRHLSERQRQGDNATYHFIDNQAIMIAFVGRQLIDLIPKIYDTERVLHIFDQHDPDSRRKIQINPQAQNAYEEQQADDVKEAALGILNPNVGEYDVIAEPGPSYATARQEAWDALVQILAQAPDLVGVVGDILMRNADFHNADKIAERLQKEIEAQKPYLFDKGLNPQVQKLMEDLQSSQSMVAELLQKLAEANLKLKGKEALRDIEAYDARTKRIVGLANSIVDTAKTGDANALQRVINMTLGSMMKDGQAIDDVIEANKPDLDAEEAGGTPESQMGGARGLPVEAPGGLPVP